MFGDQAVDPEIRPASTVLALREGSRGLEVLMVRRAKSAVFMGGARVFPGGAIDEVDRSSGDVVRWSGDPDELPWRSAAVRELAEEAGILLTDRPIVMDTTGDVLASAAAAGAVFDADRLHYFSNWVTPQGPPRRFDTRFYAVEVDEGTEARADLSEVFDPEWVTPLEALSRGDRGDWGIEFPTRRHLETISHFSSPDAVVNHVKSMQSIERIEPRVVVDDDGSWSVVMPGDPGYEEAPS